MSRGVAIAFILLLWTWAVTCVYVVDRVYTDPAGVECCR